MASVSEGGVTDSDGTFYPADIILYATGFETDRFLWPMEIRGRGGRVLSEQWGIEPSAYLGITVPNFPNFYCMYGPGTNLAFGGSLIFNGECQIRYIMECLKTLLQSGKTTIECKASVHADYQRRFRELHAQADLGARLDQDQLLPECRGQGHAAVAVEDSRHVALDQGGEQR